MSIKFLHPNMHPPFRRRFLFSKDVQELGLNFIKPLFEVPVVHTRFSLSQSLFINCNSKTAIYHDPKDFGVNVNIEVREGQNLKKSCFFGPPCS